MVMIKLLAILLAIISQLDAATPKAKVQVHTESQLASGKLEAILSVYHYANQTVDTSQVMMEDQPLPVELLFTSKMTAQELQQFPEFAPEGQVTTLRFTLEGRQQGLYVLPAISLLVNGERITTVPSTFDVPPSQAVAGLKIEPIIEPAGPFYPGQRAHFGYRIFFDQSIALSSEVLPLLSPEGFEKIGQADVKDTSTNALSMQEITQEVRARTPGSYSVPKAVIEGHNYHQNAKGQPIPIGPLITASTPAHTIEVRPFPKAGQPASFNGIVGPVELDVALISPSKVLVGDELKLSIKLRSEELEGLSLPDLSCQPGFSGFFRFSDFPAAEQTGNHAKKFTVILKPLSTLVTAIPSIETSYFDPQSESYQTVRSLPIPLVVKATAPSAHEQQLPSSQSQPWPTSADSAGIAPISPSNPGQDLQTKPMDTRILMLLLMLGAVGLAVQWWLRKQWNKRPLYKKATTSAELMSLAATQTAHPGHMAETLERALWQRLKEKNRSDDSSVKAFVDTLHRNLYGGKPTMSPMQTLKAARALYDKL